MNLDTNKFMRRMFRRIDNIVWDMMTGKTGIKNEHGIHTITIAEDGTAEVSVNPLDMMSMSLPGFATQTANEAVELGDIIVGDNQIIGWVTAKNPASFEIRDVAGMIKRYVPPKVAIMGVTGPLVVRNLFSLTGGADGLTQLMPLLMMSGGNDSKLDEILPLFFMQQATGSAGAAAPAANNMLSMLMMSKVFGKNLGGGNNGGLDIEKIMLMQAFGGVGAMGGVGAGGMNPMVMLALMGGDETPSNQVGRIPVASIQRAVTPPSLNSGQVIRG